MSNETNGNRILRNLILNDYSFIASLKRAGLSIKQIREFTILCDEGDSTIAQRLKIIMDPEGSRRGTNY